MMPRRLALKCGLWLTLAVGASMLAAPWIEADGLRRPVQNALEQALGRRVELGKIHLSLFPGPGFIVSDVLIHEDPRVGVEPFAHVQSMKARLRLSSLWTRNLEFAKLTLIEPSVNLTKPPQEAWNFLPLLQQTTGAKEPEVSRVPAFAVEGGRINFKFGDTKSNFFLSATDLEITPDRDQRGSFALRFSGQPARTDVPAQQVGMLRGAGRWTVSKAGENRIALDVELQRTSIGELARLTRGRDLGLHGMVSTEAKVSGPLSDVRISGLLRMEDLHRWDLVAPQGGSLPMRFKGRLDWPRQRLELAATRDLNPNVPLAASLSAEDLMSKAAWRAQVDALQVPIPSVLDLAAKFGAVLPDGIAVEGKISGGVRYSSTSGFEGQFEMEDSSVRLGGEGPLKVAHGGISLAGSELHLGPALVEGENGQEAEVEANYRPENRLLHLWIRATDLSVRELQTNSGAVLRPVAVPLLEQYRRGRWTGLLHYQTSEDEPGQWDGQFRLTDAALPVPGVADPVVIRSANVSLNGDRAVLSRLRARTGKIDFSGEYRYDGPTARPHRFKLIFPIVEAAELERLLLPALERRSGFFARTLRLRPRPVPEWMASRLADGVIQVGQMTGGEMEMRSLRARVIWDGTVIRLQDARAEILDGTVHGDLDVDLKAVSPVYTLHAEVTGSSWASGRIDGTMDATTSGTGPDVLLNFKSTGNFEAHGLALAPENPLRVLSGQYELSLSPGGPRIQLIGLEGSAGPEVFTGHGATLPDGPLQVEMSSARRVLRFPLTFNGAETAAAR